MNYLRLGDCLDLMPELEAGSVDLILTDPPYSLPNAQFRPEARTKQRTWGDFSTYQAFFRQFVQEALRVLKADGDLAIFCDETFYPVLYPVLYANFYAVKLVVWDKGRIGMGGAWRRQFELVLHASRQPNPEKSGQGDILRFPPVPSASRIHNSEKPVALLRFLVEKLCPEGGTVLDPFAGSASALEAARESGRSYVGFEIDPDYHAAGLARLSK